jgi:hypothetical protein
MNCLKYNPNESASNLFLIRSLRLTHAAPDRADARAPERNRRKYRRRIVYNIHNNEKTAAGELIR